MRRTYMTIPMRMNDAVNGAWVQWLPVNQAWAVMWMSQVLSIHDIYDDAEYEFNRITS